MSERSSPNNSITTSGSASSLVSIALQCLVLGGVIFIATVLGLTWGQQAGNISALWPPNAILLAFILRSNQTARLALVSAFFVANVVANIVYSSALLAALGFALANLSEVAVAYFLVKRFVGHRDAYDDTSCYLQFLLFAVLAAPVTSATIGASLIATESAAPFATVWVTWWLANALGMVIFFPLANLIASGWHKPGFRFAATVETSLTTLAACAITWFALQQSVLIVFVVIQAMLVWIVFRAGRTGGAVAVTCIGITLTILTLHGMGPIGASQNLSTAEKVLDLQALLAMLTIPMMMIAVVINGARELSATIAEKEERYRRLYDESPVMLHSIDPEGRLVSVSEYWLKKMGYRRDEVLGRKSVEFLTAESRDYAINQILPIFIRDGEVRDVEYKFVKKNGEIFDALMSAIQEPSSQSEMKRSLAVITDVSKLKETEAELSQSNEDLARSNRDLEQFAYLASHDLQEPLRMVSSFTELLEQEYAPQLDERAREFIHFARDGATRMSRMVTDILAYSRVTRNSDLIEAVNLNVAADAAIEGLKSGIEEAGAVVVVGQLPEVAGIFPQLTSLFQNLIGNAIKYRSDAPPEIEITGRKQGSEWQITVSDNGIGIDAKHYERIFDLFKRLHRRDQYEGTGIGLSVCRKIVETHGGNIWVDSNAGTGSRFHFTLPVEKPQQKAA